MLSEGFTFDHLVVFPDISDIQDEGKEYEIRNNMVVQKEADSNFLYRMSMHLPYYLGDIFPFTFHLIDQLNRVWKGTGKESYTKKEFNEIIDQRSRWTFDQQLDGYGPEGVEGAKNYKIRFNEAFQLSPARAYKRLIDGGDQTILEREPLEQVAKQGELMAFLHDGFWQCMDTKRDRDLLKKLWESNSAPWKQ